MSPLSFLIRGHFKYIIQLIKPGSRKAHWVKVLVLKPGGLLSIFRTHMVHGGQPAPANCPLTSTYYYGMYPYAN